MDETPYLRPRGYAEHYRDARFRTGHGPGTDRRERKALRRLLASRPWPPGPWLDAPAGTGRMGDVLPDPAVLADRDLAMLRCCTGDRPRVCASVAALPFRDGAFAGALCLRLLQHIPKSEERVRMLAELARVAPGGVIVSFFDAHSLQHGRRLLRRWLGKPRSGRLAVSRAAMARDLAAAGLRPAVTLALRRFVSEQTFVLAVPAPAR